MESELDKLENEAREHLGRVRSGEDLAVWRTTYLGRGGALTAILRQVGGLPPEDRPGTGRRANKLKQRLEAALQAKKRVASRFGLEIGASRKVYPLNSRRTIKSIRNFS